MKLRILAGILCVSVAVAVVWRAMQAPYYPSAYRLLKQALRAEHTTCYEAEITISTKTNGERRTATAKLYRLGRAGRIEYGSDSTGAILVTNLNETATYESARRTLTVSESCGLVNCGRKLDLLLDNYRLGVIGQALIGGRDAWVMSISPRRKRRQGLPSRTIWIDKKMHIILRTADYGPDLKPRSEMQIQNVRTCDKLPLYLFRVPKVSSSAVCVKLEKCATFSKASEQLGYAVRSPRYIPEGFILEGVRVCRCNCGCGFKSAQVRYTDGLRFISVYEEVGKPGCKRCGSYMKPSSAGACPTIRAGNEAMAVFHCKQGRVIVVADMHPSEVRRIAKSVN